MASFWWKTCGDYWADVIVNLFLLYIILGLDNSLPPSKAKSFIVHIFELSDSSIVNLTSIAGKLYGTLFPYIGQCALTSDTLP